MVIGWFRRKSATISRGRVMKLSEYESFEKAALALRAVASAQKDGGTAAYIDAEHTLDIDLVRSSGIDPDKLLFSQPTCAEEALAICECLVKSGQIDVVVIDSIASLVPQAVIYGLVGETQCVRQMRELERTMRRLTSEIRRTDTLCIFT